MQRLEEEERGAGGSAGSVARIMYASRAAIRGSVYAEMERIRASALRHNQPAGVATALLYQSGWFLQWKEGPGAALRRSMDRVAGDARHHALRAVHGSRGRRLLDGAWSMAVVHCDELPAAMERRVDELRRAVDEGLLFSPPAIWRLLSTPMAHPGAWRPEDADGFHRLMVCAASGTASFELVHRLAHQHREAVVHRRFAGAQCFDVATDYVDFAHVGGRIMRVIAMARNGLHVPLTRAFLPDYSHLVLLLSGDAARDQDLVYRVVQACAGLEEPPPLVAVAAREEDHAALFVLARRCGHIYLQAVADPQSPAASWMAIQPLLARWRPTATGAPAPALRRRAVAQ